MPTKNKFVLTPQSSSELGELFGCGKLPPPPSQKENGPSREWTESRGDKNTILR